MPVWFRLRFPIQMSLGSACRPLVCRSVGIVRFGRGDTVSDSEQTPAIPKSLLQRGCVEDTQGVEKILRNVLCWQMGWQSGVTGIHPLESFLYFLFVRYSCRALGSTEPRHHLKYGWFFKVLLHHEERCVRSFFTSAIPKLPLSHSPPYASDHPSRRASGV